MNKIRAKFYCNNIEAFPTAKQKVVKLRAVTSGSEENKSFSKYTPSGLLELNISDETPAVDFFQPGEEYYLDIIKKTD